MSADKVATGLASFEDSPSFRMTGFFISPSALLSVFCVLVSSHKDTKNWILVHFNGLVLA
jgi:hypothetical protein